MARHSLVPISSSNVTDSKITLHLLSGNSDSLSSFSDTKIVLSWYMKKSCIMVMKQPHVFLILFVILFFTSVLSMSMWGDLGIWKSPITQFLYGLFPKCFNVDVCGFFVSYKGSMNESSRNTNTHHIEPGTIGICVWFALMVAGSWKLLNTEQIRPGLSSALTKPYWHLFLCWFLVVVVGFAGTYF